MAPDEAATRIEHVRNFLGIPAAADLFTAPPPELTQGERQNWILYELYRDQAEMNGAHRALQAEHNAVMAGEKAGCRHLEVMRASFWKFLAISLGIPLALMVIGAILSLAYFKQ